MNDLVDFEKLKFLWKLLISPKFPITYFSKIKKQFLIKKISKCYTFFRLTLYNLYIFSGVFSNVITVVQREMN